VDAKAAQAAAAVAAASATRDHAAVQVARIRRLYADSAAPKAMLDAAETGLAQAEAGLLAATAGGAEVESVRAYAVVHAPFAGTITRRFVDPGAFASPGMPLATIQDASRLRVAATATPDVARALVRGAALDATVDGRPAPSTPSSPTPNTSLLPARRRRSPCGWERATRCWCPRAHSSAKATWSVFVCARGAPPT
jgi:multidrug efflux pump subunit AcrA (membrane-fusion protein)